MLLLAFTRLAHCCCWLLHVAAADVVVRVGSSAHALVQACNQAYAAAGVAAVHWVRCRRVVTASRCCCCCCCCWCWCRCCCHSCGGVVRGDSRHTTRGQRCATSRSHSSQQQHHGVLQHGRLLSARDSLLCWHGQSYHQCHSSLKASLEPHAGAANTAACWQPAPHAMSADRTPQCESCISSAVTHRLPHSPTASWAASTAAREARASSADRQKSPLHGSKRASCIRGSSQLGSRCQACAAAARRCNSSCRCTQMQRPHPAVLSLQLIRTLVAVTHFVLPCCARYMFTSDMVCSGCSRRPWES